MKATERKSDQTRTRILQAALRLFRQRGFEQATMRDIAKEARVALGAAYYYFDSKDAIVMAFYELAQMELAPRIEDGLANTRDLRERLAAVIAAKFDYFEPNRNLLGTLSSHIDPQHPLSPFSRATKAIRERDISFIHRAIEGSTIKVAGDLKPYLARLLWLYQMGLILFWIYDHSPKQRKTAQLFEKSLAIVLGLIKLSALPLTQRIRKLVTNLLDVIYQDGSSAVESRS
jgi:AcrR family transcriptional regulator